MMGNEAAREACQNEEQERIREEMFQERIFFLKEKEGKTRKKERKEKRHVENWR